MGLQVFNLRNYQEPFGALALASLPYAALVRGDAPGMIREMVRGWRLGRDLPNLFLSPIEELLALDLDEARARLGIPEGARLRGAVPQAVSPSTRRPS
jgi:hypothetical protein